MKNLLIEWRHLDVDGDTCNRCYDTGENLTAEIKRLNRALNPQGIEVKFKETKLNESEISESNVILFNNIPLEELLDIEIHQSYCGSCSDLVGKDTYCRAIKYEGNDYEDVPAKAIREAAYKAMGLKTNTSAQTSCCDSTSDCGCGSGTTQNDFWHPIIDNETCTECGICVDKCGNGVFDKGSPQKPVIVKPENCVDGCHGCGQLCPSGSITYMGDTTGWIPPNASNAPRTGEANNQNKKGDTAMKKMFIYEPALCCETGLCGVSVDPELLRISTVANNLKKNGVTLQRYNLKNSPQEFVNNTEINKILNSEGVNVLPVTVVDGKIVKTKTYPTNGEIVMWLNIPADYIVEKTENSDCGCGCGSGKSCC